MSSHLIMWIVIVCQVTAPCTKVASDQLLVLLILPSLCAPVLIFSWVFYNAAPRAEFVPQRLFCNNLSHAYFI